MHAPITMLGSAFFLRRVTEYSPSTEVCSLTHLLPQPQVQASSEESHLFNPKVAGIAVLFIHSNVHRAPLLQHTESLVTWTFNVNFEKDRTCAALKPQLLTEYEFSYRIWEYTVLKTWSKHQEGYCLRFPQRFGTVFISCSLPAMSPYQSALRAKELSGVC
ncbi:uncharacterized protein LY89DRAFT_273478 [Mollisia scopiformis]|uniref:Uncharacterized protein n=1 Tax=Mollisia scopiformis TaxID=149040 RepID=A0A132BC45_MOLSC|nr:uncharacterized protein LY89DRAFT_273478 [Mollisia scopiformis]KUJ09579.1 hypothetical protein LY89DRAFT_273478 [Mollisia scopiformis]